MAEKKQDLALIAPEELSLVDNNSLNAKQLALILKKTPERHVQRRKGRGGEEWDFVSGGYMRKVLNLMFGFDWDFEVIEHWILDGEIVVNGKLTCRCNGRTIVKMQFGNKEIMYRKQTDEDKKAGKPRIPLSIGNDMKSAATDALKKCASQIGIAADIYNKDEFREVQVDTEEVTLESIKELYEIKKEALSPEDQIRIEQIIKDPMEAKSYRKIYKKLQAL